MTLTAQAVRGTLKFENNLKKINAAEGTSAQFTCDLLQIDTSQL